MIALRAIRELAGLSQRELGAAVGVSASEISRYESGMRAAWPTALRIAAALGVTADELLERDPPDEPTIFPSDEPPLAALLRDRGFSTRSFAEAVGVARSALADLARLRGSIDLLVRVADGLEVGVDDLGRAVAEAAGESFPDAIVAPSSPLPAPRRLRPDDEDLKRAAISPTDLAAVLGVTPRTVDLMLRGETEKGTPGASAIIWLWPRLSRGDKAALLDGVHFHKDLD